MSDKYKLKPVDANPNFVEEEERLLEHWYKDGVVENYLHKNDKADKRFSFFDGPITANNPMGVHHGWGRTYKDLWQKYHNLKGFKQRFQNGFDCQGLWVEVEVEKELGFKSKMEIEKYGVEKFVEACKARVHKFSGIQTEQTKRLGNFMDWDNSYFTMSDHNNYMIWHFLKVCHENGWIYKGKDSVPWCPRCQTAISQHEMLTEDYKVVTHKAIYFELPIVDRDNEYLLVWTTTPWTVPANIAVAVDPSMEYALVEGTTGMKFWVAKDAVERIFGSDMKGVVKVVKGSELVGLKYRGPFDALPAVAEVAHEHPDTFHAVVPTDPLILPITATEGTGLVHTAVSAGAEDFKLGKQLNLPMVPVIDDAANYLEDLGFLSDQNAKKHPEIILDYLVEEDKKEGVEWVFKIEDYTHRYPACWRCKTELVWKVTEEWYIAMDKPGKASKNPATLRERMKSVAKKINWLPSFGLERELDWLTNMHDWLISKPNRYWGLAMPIYECPKCGNFEVIGSKEELKERAVSGWEEFEGHSPHRPWIDSVKIKCSKCDEVVSRVLDVGNVWLDAGIIPFSTLVDPETGKLSYTSDKEYWRKWFPADFITESFPGQFKNWFYAMIAMSTVLEDTNPYKTVLGYASMLAEDGRPMHKSWGNAIEFNEGAEKIGVDIMRWMYSRQNPVNNLLFGYNYASDVRRRFFLILWNSYRFFVNNAASDGWAGDGKLLPVSHVLDRWVLSRFVSSAKMVEESLNNFDAFHATAAVESFVDDLSTWYIRRSRDRVGPTAKDAQDRETAYSVMHYIFTNLSIILSPFIPYLTERMYTNLTGEPSVHLATWPELDESLIDVELEDSMKVAREVVEKVHAVRKEKSIKVRQPLGKVDVTSMHPAPEILKGIVLDELNVKEWKWHQSKGPQESGTDTSVDLDTEITPELEAEGRARDLIRDIQQARKVAGTTLTDKVKVTLPDWPSEFEGEIMRKTNAVALLKGDALSVEIV